MICFLTILIMNYAKRFFPVQLVMLLHYFQFNVENICVSDTCASRSDEINNTNKIRVLRGIFRRRSHNRRHFARRRSTCAVPQPIAGKLVTGKRQRVSGCYENIPSANRKRNFLERRYDIVEKGNDRREFVYLSILTI